MLAKPALLIGIGKSAEPSLLEIRAVLRDAYGKADIPVEALYFCFETPRNKDAIALKQTGHIQTLALSTDIDEWIGPQSQSNLPLTQHWYLNDRRHKLPAAQQSTDRQFMRLIFLYHLTRPQSPIQQALQTALKNLQKHTANPLEIHFIGSLTDMELLAWYIDLANFVRYELHQYHSEAHFLFHLAVPNFTGTLNNRAGLPQKSFAFFQELEHFDRHPNHTPLPLYPSYMAPMHQYNANQPMYDLLFLYPQEENDHSTSQQITNGILPLLDNAYTTEALTNLLTNRDAQRITQINAGITGTLIRTSGLHLPLGKLRSYWTRRLAKTALNELQVPSQSWLKTYTELTQGIAYKNPFSDEQIALPDLLTNLYTIQQQASTYGEPTQRLQQCALHTLDPIFLKSDPSTVLDSHRNYPQDQAGNLFVKSVNARFKATFIDNAPSSQYLHTLQNYIQAKYSQSVLTAAFCGAATYSQQTGSIDTALQVMQHIAEDLTSFAQNITEAQLRLKHLEHLLNDLEANGRSVHKLRERRFLHSRQLSKEAQIYIEHARQIFTDAQRHYAYKIILVVIEQIQNLVQQITAELIRNKALVWNGEQSFINQVRPKPLPQLDKGLPLSTQWIDTYYETTILPHIGSLQQRLTWRWVRSQNNHISRLEYQISGIPIQDGLQAAQLWQAEAERLTASAVTELGLWEAIQKANLSLTETTVAAYLSQLPDYPIYTQPTPSPAHTAALYIAKPLVDSAVHVTTTQQLYQLMPTTYALSKPIELNERTFIIYHQTIRPFPIKTLQTYQTARRAYKRLSITERAKCHILPAEVQAAQYNLNSEADVQLRMLFSYPEALQNILEMLVLQILILDGSNHYRIDTPTLDSNLTDLTTQQPPHLTDAVRTLIHHMSDQTARTAINWFIEQEREAAIDDLLNPQHLVSRTHETLWQALRDLNGITNPQPYERAANFAQMVHAYKQQIEVDTANPDTPFKELLKTLADYHVNQVIQQLKDAVFSH